MNINKYCIDDLLNDIRKFLQTDSFSNEKVEISTILINYLPILEHNDINDKIIKKHKDIIEIYSYKYLLIFF